MPCHYEYKLAWISITHLAEGAKLSAFYRGNCEETGSKSAFLSLSAMGKEYIYTFVPLKKNRPNDLCKRTARLTDKLIQIKLRKTKKPRPDQDRNRKSRLNLERKTEFEHVESTGNH